MKRVTYQKLLAWKQSSSRKPLVLRGARQVGKTYLLEHFAKQAYEDVVYLNFDEEPKLASFFEEDLDPNRIIKELELYYKVTIKPGKTLLIYDEVQECPNALNSLKYMCEKRNDQHVASAGSLLGVKLTKGFPVGKVNFIDLAPLSFFEFLDAIGEFRLRELIEQQTQPKQLNEAFHHKLTKLLKYYFVIGGMPEAVQTYVQTQSLDEVRRVQSEILDAYLLDFAKHAPKSELIRISEVWDLVPKQLAKENKKFIFSVISKSARAREYSTAIQWLIDAGLIIRTCNTSSISLPLEAYADKHIFKIYCLDVGLLGALSKLAPNILLEGDELFKEFKGALTENFVAQELKLHHEDLYYWTSQGEAEVDFLIQTDNTLYPLEVKAGMSRRTKSLQVYAEKCASDANLSRATLRNFAHDGKVINYPLYAVALFPFVSR